MVTMASIEYGSSPLARGLHAEIGRAEELGRIIPARAGFTPVDNPGDFGHEDHPRSRGVYHSTITSSPYFLGSSPLARGLLSIVVTALSQVRIIPARAGFTDGG